MSNKMRKYRSTGFMAWATILFIMAIAVAYGGLE